MVHKHRVVDVEVDIQKRESVVDETLDTVFLAQVTEGRSERFRTVKIGLPQHLITKRIRNFELEQFKDSIRVQCSASLNEFRNRCRYGLRHGLPTFQSFVTTDEASVRRL
jgi:hypothetical protein